MADFLRTLGLMIRVGLEVKIKCTFKVLFYFSDFCGHSTSIFLESIHIWTIGTIHSWLLF